MFRNIDNNISQYNWHKLCIWLGSVILIIIGFLLIVFKSINFLLTMIILAGLMILGQNFYSYIGMDKLNHKRLRKIGTISTTYSWYITLIFIILLSLLDLNFKSLGMLGLMIIVMVSSI